MARLFDDGASDTLYEAATVYSLPISLSAWFRFDVEPDNMIIVSVGDEGGTAYSSLRAFATGDVLSAASFEGGTASSNHATDMAANIWYHGLAVFASTTSRICYLDGTTAVENTVEKVITMDRTGVGVSGDGTPFGHFSGDIAEVAIWNHELTGVDAAMLAQGYSPLFIRAHNLLAYWPLIRGLNDKVAGLTLTASGTAVSNHPRVIYPSEIWTPHKAGVAPTGNAGIMTTNTGFWGVTY